MTENAWEISILMTAETPADAHRLMDDLVTQLKDPHDGIRLHQIGMRTPKRRPWARFQRIYAAKTSITPAP